MLKHHSTQSNKHNSFEKRPTYQMKNRNMVPNPDKSAKIQRKPYFIMEGSSNLTPKPLTDAMYPSDQTLALISSSTMKTLMRLSSSSTLRDRMDSVSTRSFLRRSTRAKSSYSLQLAAPSYVTWSSIGMFSDEEEEDHVLLDEDRAPSMFRLREDPPPRTSPRMSSFTVNLTETQTMFHIQLPSEAADMLTDAGIVNVESNLLYQKAAQTIKTKTDTATQTDIIYDKVKTSSVLRNQRANASTFASVWDIYDCSLTTPADTVSAFSIPTEGKVLAITEHVQEDDTFEYEGQIFNSRFLNSLMVMERLIQQKSFERNQLLYQGFTVQDPLSTDVVCTYTLSLLWTFKSAQTKNKSVTSICCSSTVENILAVGYGKFKYTDKCGGLVCIWNIKNPHDPERMFHFEDPVTYVTFSQLKPQILAIAFYSGLVLLVDITSRSLMIKASNRHYPLYHPVWQIHWVGSEENSSSLNLVTCSKNGIIYKYKKTKFFSSKKIMSVTRPNGKIEGVDLPRKCFARKTQSSDHPSIEVLVRHPQDPLLYLVGTSEGCVHTCSFNHRYDHMDVFVAHHGPVYAIQFNPFCSKVLLTSGADWCIRVWAETVYEPLMTLQSGMMAIYNAVWSPVNATIIVATTGSFIEVWDIRRKVIAPKSTTESPSKSLATVLQFTENKSNVCVGDVDGNVHVMALTEMPFNPIYQEDVLAESILNQLISQPELRRKLCRLGPPFAASEESSYMAKMYRKLNKLRRSI